MGARLQQAELPAVILPVPPVLPSIRLHNQLAAPVLKIPRETLKATDPTHQNYQSVT